MRSLALVVVLAMLATPVVTAQPREAFEVASVRRNTSGAPGSGGPTATLGDTPTGFSATNVTLRMLIRRAYGFEDRFIMGGPGWVEIQRFDIRASAGAEVSRDRIAARLRTLLEERFKLVVAVEQRQRDAYTLRLARSDGRLGPELRKAAGDCHDKRPDALERVLAAAKSMPRPSNGALPSSGGACSTIENVAGHISNTLDATVIDETGLTGRWDWVISHTGVQSAVKRTRDGTMREYPSIFAALEEQLGLKIERRREPALFDVLVIKSADFPTEN